MKVIQQIQSAAETCRKDGNHEAADFFEEILKEVKELTEARKAGHSPVELAAIAWWRSYTPEGQDDETHALDPYYGLPYRHDWLLADTVLNLLGLAPENHEEDEDR